jgi:large subunit ribosomal protein L9
MPEAILLEDVEGVGTKGAVVDVSKGYLRNFLLPRKLAQPATKGALAVAAQLAAQGEKQRAEDLRRAEGDAATLDKTVLTLERKAGDDGRLFGSVTNQDIAEAIHEARGIAVDRRKIRLEEPLKSIGTHMVTVEVAEGVTATVKTMVVEQT